MSDALFAELTPERLAARIPTLHVGGPLRGSAAEAAQGVLPADAGLLATRGWFDLTIATRGHAAILEDAVGRLEAAGLPRAALYVFDEVWELGRTLSACVSRAIGADYGLIEDLWAFSIPPGSAGWPAHRGVYAPLDRHRPEYLNAWIALSDAGPERSCMHLVPLEDDRAYLDGRFDVVDEGRGIAAPLLAGQAGVWNANVLHWGGACAPDAAGPRRSLTFTLCRSDATARADLGPARTLDPTALDPWQRLSMIAGQVLLYSDRDGLTDDVRAWATATSRLATRFAGG